MGLLKEKTSLAFSIFINLLSINQIQIQNTLRKYKKLKKKINTCLTENDPLLELSLKLLPFVDKKADQNLLTQFLQNGNVRRFFFSSLKIFYVSSDSKSRKILSFGVKN